MENEDVALLQLMLTRGLGIQTLRRLLIRMAEGGESPADVVSRSTTDAHLHSALKPEIALAIPAAYEEAISLYRDLEQHEIQILAIGQPSYPTRLQKVLGETAPPILFACGNLDLLESQSVGFCGSRKASELGLKTTRVLAKAIAESGITIVSGYAHGVDLAAHAGAIEGGGTTTMVLAEGILRFRMKADISEFVSDRNWVVVSEFTPRLGWIARNAMQRNRTICGLSDAAILVEPGLRGGTFAAGETALELHRPLFVVEYPKSEPKVEANDYFLSKGATALASDYSNAASVASVIRAATLEQDTSGHDAQPRQQSLFG